MTPNLISHTKFLTPLLAVFPSLLFNNNETCMDSNDAMPSFIYLKVAKVNTNLQAYEN